MPNCIFFFQLSIEPLLELIYHPGLNYWTFLSLYLCSVLFCLLLLLFLLFCNRMTCCLKKEKEQERKRQMAFNLLFFAFTCISLSLICEWQVDKLNLCLNQPKIIDHQPRFFFSWNDFFSMRVVLQTITQRTQRGDKQKSIRSMYLLKVKPVSKRKEESVKIMNFDVGLLEHIKSLINALFAPYRITLLLARNPNRIGLLSTFRRDSCNGAKPL